MPKEIYEIKDFSGGLVNGPDPRDLEDNMLHKLVNCVSNNFGRIQPMGEERPHAITQEAGAVSANLTPGYGLQAIKVDFPFVAGSYDGYQFDCPHIVDHNQEDTSLIWYRVAGTSSDRIKVTNDSQAEHHLSTFSQILLRDTLNVTTWDLDQWTDVYYIDAYSFEYISPTGNYSGLTDSAVNWVSGDYKLTYDDLESGMGFPDIQSASYTFLCLQNGNFFHIYQNETKNFFYDVCQIVESTTGINIKPHFIYIDNGMRMCDSNFNNLTATDVINSNDSYSSDYSPRIFFYNERQKNLLLSDVNSVFHLRQAGWRDENNNVYEALDVLSNTMYSSTSGASAITIDNAGGANTNVGWGTGNALFNVEDKANDTNDASHTLTNNVWDNPLQVNMSVTCNSASGDFMFASIHKNMKFGVAYVFDKDVNQESRLFKNQNEVEQSSAADYGSLNFEFHVSKDLFPARCVGFSIYIWYLNGVEIDDPLWLGRALFSNKDGWNGHDGAVLPWIEGTPDNISKIQASGDDILRMQTFPVLTYSLRNDGTRHNYDSATFRYKAATVCNRKLYVGNVMQVGGRNHNRVYHDRMIKSPMNKFDILPADNFIEVATNDGDEIVKLVSFRDQILQFKTNSLYIINVSQTYEYLQAEEKFKGIRHPDSVTKFDGGIVWANNNGAYLYDGQQVTDIVDGRIERMFWRSCVGDSKISVGYLTDQKQIVFYIKYNPYSSFKIDSISQGLGGSVHSSEGSHDHLLLYDLSTQTWSFGQDKLSADVKTNLIDDFDDKLVFGVGAGLTTEQHSVGQISYMGSPEHCSGYFSFSLEEGTLYSETYNHLWFYFNDTGSGSSGWVDISAISPVSFSSYNTLFTEENGLAEEVAISLASIIQDWNTTVNQVGTNMLGYEGTYNRWNPDLNDEYDQDELPPT